MLQPIIDSLARLNEIYEELLLLAKRKREALIKTDAAQLTSIHQEEISLLKQADQREKERLEQTALFLQKAGQEKQEVTLAELIEFVTEDQQKQELTDGALELQQTIRELQEYNDFNTQLISDSLQFIQYSLDLFTDQWTDQVNYQPPAAQQGKHSSSERRSIFDTKA